MMTNQPTPVILDDEALAEIEARRPRTERNELQSRLAQVEKERDELRRQL